MSRMPVIFISHGAPLLAIDDDKGRVLTTWGERLPKPKGILAVSAHWLSKNVTIGTVYPTELMYDFRGFPSALYRVKYPAPGAPEIKDMLMMELNEPGLASEESRMWDHGVWVPLVHLYPQADIPVLQISVPYTPSFHDLIELGRNLRFLRERGVLIMATGSMTHNLKEMFVDGAETPAWAKEFDEWAKDRLLAKDFAALEAFESVAPHSFRNHPTPEHFAPLLVACGAAIESDEITFPIEGFEFGSLSRRSVQFG